MRLRFSYMHPRFQRSQDGKELKNRLGIMKENNAYLIVTRAGRQIDLVARPHFGRPADDITIVNYDRNWAIELDFDPILDEEFGITVNKQQVTLSERIWQKLADEKIPTIVKGLRSRFKKENDDLKEETQKRRTSEEVMKEAAKFSTRQKNKPSDKKQERARQNATSEAKKKAEQTGESEEQVIQGLLEEYAAWPFIIEFESLEGAPFYRVEQYGPQVRVWINRRHRFYTDMYSSADGRLRSALELLLFTMGSCEVESEGDRELFYSVERTEWSRRLETTLALLDRRASVDDAGSAAAEAEEIATAESENVA